MKSRFYLFAAACLTAVAVVFASCSKEDDAQSFETTGRIASYYGVAKGEGAVKVLNVFCDGRWSRWPEVKGLDYEEGYEYEVKVRIDRRRDLDGMMDVMFDYDVTCIEVLGKVAVQTDDCPLQSWDEFVAEHPEYGPSAE